MKKICLQISHTNMAVNSIPALRGSTGAPGEQKWLMDIVPKVQKKLIEAGLNVITCDGSANDNKNITNTDWDAFYSFHYDADIYKESGGFVAFPDPATDDATKESQRLAKILSDTYFKETGIKNFPNRSNNNTKFYYMWRYLSSSTPCVLIECGVGNRKPNDYEILHNKQEVVIKAIVNGICKSFDVKSPYDKDTDKDKIKELEKQVKELTEKNNKLVNKISKAKEVLSNES